MLAIMKAHEKKYKDGDELSASQAAEVIGENSGRVVDPVNVARLVKQGRIPGARKVGRFYVYPYESVRNVVVGELPTGPKPKPEDQLAERSLYIREYKRRKAVEKKRKGQGS